MGQKTAEWFFTFSGNVLEMGDGNPSHLSLAHLR